MNYDLLILLLCAEFSIIVALIILLSRKRKIISEYEEKQAIEQKEKLKLKQAHYYSLQSSLDKYKEQIQSINDYNKELEDLNKQKENLLNLRKSVLQQKEKLLFKEKHAEKLYMAETNIVSLNKISNTILKTTNIDVLQTEYKSGLEVLRWLINEKYTLMAFDLFGKDVESLLNSFKEQFNEAIIRIADYHLLKYKTKFYELYTAKARQSNTQRIFILIDTLCEMVEIDLSNSDFVLEKLNEYHSQVEDIFSFTQNYG